MTTITLPETELGKRPTALPPDGLTQHAFSPPCSPDLRYILRDNLLP